MTFRIDEAELRDCGWYFSFKGVDGKGLYGRLITKPDGRGLYLVDPDDALLRKRGRCLRHSWQFSIPASASSGEAMRLIAGELLLLGWGPEVNQAGKIISILTVRK